MPKLPVYERQVIAPAVEGPQIPLSFGQAETAAMGQAAGQVADTAFKLLDQEVSLKRKAEFAEMAADISLQLHEMKTKALTSPEFYQDPEAAGRVFAEQTTALKQQYLERVKDPQVQILLKSHLARESVAHLDSVSNAVIKQRNALGEGKYWNAVVKLKSLAESTPDEVEAEKYLGQGLSMFRGMEQNGLMKPEERVKQEEKFKSEWAERRALVAIQVDPDGAKARLNSGEGPFRFLRADRRTALAEHATREADHRSNVARQDSERAEKERVKASNIAAYGSIYNSFGLTDPDRGNFAGAVAFLENPDNAKALGLNSVEQVKEVSAMIETQRNQRRAARDDAIKQTNEKTKAQMLDLYNKNQLTSDIIANSNLPETDQAHWRAAIKAKSEDADTTNPVVFNDAYTKVLTGEYRSKSDLPLPGNGISGKDTSFLREEWDKAQDPTKSRYYTMLGTEYDRVFKDTPDLKEKREEFLVILAHEVRTKKLEGEAIYERGRKLMKETERSWVDSALSVVPGSGVPWRAPREFETNEWLNPPAQPEPTTTLTPAAKVRELPKPDPAISSRVSELRKTMSEQEISKALKAKKVDPTIYGLPNNE